jgi:hypothetical protein
MAVLLRNSLLHSMSGCAVPCMPMYARCSWYTVVLRRPLRHGSQLQRAPLLTAITCKLMLVALGRCCTPHPAFDNILSFLVSDRATALLPATSVKTCLLLQRSILRPIPTLCPVLTQSMPVLHCLHTEIALTMSVTMTYVRTATPRRLA